jgi:hypothetical protein
LLKSLSLSSALVVSACIADSRPTSELVRTANDSTVIYILPCRAAGAVASAAVAGAHLTNYGGPTLTSISVAPLFWNSNVQFQPNLNWVYSEVPLSPLWDMLAQYGIKRGSGRAGVVGTGATAEISDRAIQTEVMNQINAGRLPPPTANTYYPVHFPPNMSITDPNGRQSCVVFCAYHGTFHLQTSAGTAVNVNYGVIPDQGGGCANTCGANPQRVNNLTSVASHELIEAATDPAVGLATVIGPPLAWYDPNNGEIADICNGQQGTTTIGNGRTHTIQLEFSNAANDCVAK